MTSQTRPTRDDIAMAVDKKAFITYDFMPEPSKDDWRAHREWEEVSRNIERWNNKISQRRKKIAYKIADRVMAVISSYSQ